MTSSGTGDNEPEAPAYGDRVGARERGTEGGRWEEPKWATRRFQTSRLSRAERDRMVKEARAITFPTAVRGYERRAVDRYVQEVNRLIAELEVSSLPEAAVRNALAEVGEETRELLQRAHETADEVVLRARATAADVVQEAEREAEDVRNAAQRETIEARDVAAREAEELLAAARGEAAALREAAAREAAELQETAGREAEQVRTAAKAEADNVVRAASEKADQLLKGAETHARELTESADGIWRERRRLIEDVRVVGEQLLALGEAESRRFARPTVAAGVAKEDSAEPNPTGAELAATLQANIEDSRPVRGELH